MTPRLVEPGLALTKKWRECSVVSREKTPLDKKPRPFKTSSVEFKPNFAFETETRVLSPNIHRKGEQGQGERAKQLPKSPPEQN